MNKIEYRPYSETFAEALAEAERICFSDPWSLEALHDFFSYPYNNALLAVREKTLIGYVTYTVIDGEVQIANVAVLPRYRRIGVARGMLDALTGLAAAEGLKKMTLEVRASNVAALALYASSGFVQVGSRRGFYRHPPETAILLDKAISRTQTEEPTKG